MRHASPIRTKPLIRTGKYGERGKVDVGGAKSSTTHKGVDIRAAVGTPFYPIRPGKVVQTIKGWTSERNVGRSAGRGIFSPGMGGNQVVIDVGGGELDNYAHAQGIDVSVGQQVSLNTQLGRTGKSGGSKMAPHLHVGIWVEKGGQFIALDPTMRLPWEGDTHDQYSLIKPKPGESIATPGATQVPNTPTAPVETAAEREERELMSARDDIIDAIKTEARITESRIRREVRPEPYFISEGADGRKYTIDDSPAAALVQPGTGFIMPLNASVDGKRGQVESLKANYRITAFDTQANGFPERVFWNTIKDVARGAGIIDRRVSEADGIAWARALFGLPTKG